MAFVVCSAEQPQRRAVARRTTTPRSARSPRRIGVCSRAAYPGGSGDSVPEAPPPSLSDEARRVLYNKGTEKRFSGALLNEKRAGVYRCAGCGAEIFRSEDKYESNSGWPAFTRPAEESAVYDKLDLSNNSFRFEVLCSACNGHLGHHFPDVTPTGLRYCINSVAMAFEPGVDADAADGHTSAKPPRADE